MQSNLIVIKNGEIAFSNYFFKPNGFLMKMSLASFIVDKEGKNAFFNIPLRSEGIIQTLNYQYGAEVSAETQIYPGAYSVSIGSSILVEYCCEIKGSKTDIVSLILPKHANDSWYVKAPIYDLESAATAAAQIHKTAEQIYKASFNAFMYTYPQFYTAKLTDIFAGIESINFIFKMKDKNKMKKLIRNLSKANDESIAKIFLLKCHS